MMHQCLAFVVTILIGQCLCVVPTQYGAVPIGHPEERPTEPCVEWTGGTFEWPCAQTKSLYKSSGKYISKNVIATRAQIVGENVYVALPRYKSGVPATLARTQFRKGSCAATLSPFPCWSMQEVCIFALKYIPFLFFLFFNKPNFSYFL